MPTKSARRIPQQDLPENVVAFRLGILPRHDELLGRWLKAGRCMGLCDASIYPPEAAGGLNGGYVLVWVRENPDPAYMVAPAGMRWVVTDYLRSQVLTRVRTFGEALNFIRPVLPHSVAA